MMRTHVISVGVACAPAHPIGDTMSAVARAAGRVRQRHPCHATRVSVWSATQELDAVVIVKTLETEVLSNAELARYRSTPEHRVAAIVFRGNTLALEPPLPCPRGHGDIGEAIWGRGRAWARP